MSFFAFTKYVVMATKNGFIDIDGKYVIVTDKGEKEMNEITEKCMALYDSAMPEEEKLENVTKDFNKVYNTKYNSREMFCEALKTILHCGDADLLTFLLAEKESNYAQLGKVVEGFKKESGKDKKRGLFSVVRGSKLDS